MMAKDFWQLVSIGHHVSAARLSAPVSLNPHESTPVVATFWQRTLGAGLRSDLFLGFGILPRLPSRSLDSAAPDSTGRLVG